MDKPPAKALPMSAPMVLAWLAGRKTKTRRLFRQQPKIIHDLESPRSQKKGDLFLAPDLFPTTNERKWIFALAEGRGTTRCLGLKEFIEIACPYGKPGSLVYITEHWRGELSYDSCKPSELAKTVPIWYEADGTHGALVEPDGNDKRGRFRNSRFMCRWMSRAEFPLVSVRAERLGDITHDDAIAEGIEWMGNGWKDYRVGYNGAVWQPEFAIDSFISLWTSIHGENSWAEDREKFVWVLSLPKPTDLLCEKAP